MDKLSNEKIAHVLRYAETALLKIASERDKALEELAAFKQQSECEKVAAMMHEKGLETDRSIEELAAGLAKEAEAGRLGEITRAVDMIGPNMSFASQLSNHDNPGGGSDALTGYLLGNVS